MFDFGQALFLSWLTDVSGLRRAQLMLAEDTLEQERGGPSGHVGGVSNAEVMGSRDGSSESLSL